MQIIFRKDLPQGSATAGEGEILLRPRLEYADRRDLANLVVEQGLAALPHAMGAIHHIVVVAEPALDDMLAATFVMRLLTGQALPQGCRAWARYAALVREGQRPGKYPLEVSPQGMHLAIRTAVPGDLTQEDNAARFNSKWGRLGQALLEAAANDVDPFTASPVAQDPEFTAERTFLTNDHTAYRQDLARGEEWHVSLPGGQEGTSLLLRRPTTQLYQFWSRFAEDSPGGAHQFLAVEWGHGQWVFSTGPAQGISLQTLAEVLQRAELAHKGPTAAQNPWYDGAAFGHTIIAAPHGGSVLAEETVLRLVKKWCRARPLQPRKTHLRETVLAASLAAILLTVLALWLGRGGPQHRGMLMEDDNGPSPADIKGNLHLVSIGVSRYANSKFNLTYADKDAVELNSAFLRHRGDLFEKVSPKVLTNDKARREDIIATLEALKPEVTQHDLVVVTVSGHGANLEEDDQFYFMPHDYNEQRKGATGVFWDDFARYLKLPCRVFLVMDTCHSGTITKRIRSTEESKAALTRQLDKKNLPRAEKGMIVWAACLSQGTAQEHPDWRHGALTLALLEGLSGRYYFTAKTATALPKGTQNTVNLKDLDYYVSNRVKELVGGTQAVVSNNTGNLVLQNIPIAVRAGGSR